MAKKSNNIVGNPYHDEDGKFTSKGDLGEKIEKISTPLKLKTGIDQNVITGAIQNSAILPTPNNNVVSSQLINPDGSLVQPKNLNEAMNQGDQILGAQNIVHYDNIILLENAFEFNKALNDINKDFSGSIKNANLISYGVSNKTLSQKNLSKNLYNFANQIASIFTSPEMTTKFTNANVDPNRVTKMIQSIKMEIPKLVSDLPKKIRKGSSADGLTTIAAANFNKITTSVHVNYSSGITFNKESYSGKNFSDMENSIKSGYHFDLGDKTIPYATAAHELGHLIYYSLANVMDDNEIDEWKDLLKTSGVSNQKETYQNLYNNKEISGYAFRSRDPKMEHIAEAFSDVYCRGKGATTHNKRIVDFFKRMNDKYFNK